VNPAALSAWVQQNKTTLAVVGAAGAVGFGLMSKGKRPEEPAPNGGAAVSAGSAVGSPVPVGGYAAYDSTGSDLYNAIQPQLEGLGGLLGQLQQQQKGAPTPLFTAGFVKDTGTGRVYQLDETGNVDWLGPGELRQIAGDNPNVRAIAKDSPFWSTVKRIDAKDAATYRPPA